MKLLGLVRTRVRAGVRILRLRVVAYHYIGHGTHHVAATSPGHDDTCNHRLDGTYTMAPATTGHEGTCTTGPLNRWTK